MAKSAKSVLPAALGCFAIFLLMTWAFTALLDRAILDTDCDFCREEGGPCEEKLTLLGPVLVGINLVVAFFVAEIALAAKNFWRWVGVGFAVNAGIVVTVLIYFG